MRHISILLLCFAPALALFQLNQKYSVIPVILVGLFIVNIACYLSYRIDKQRAESRHKRRIPEATLHTLELLGGWPAGLLAQWHFRHKTRKLSYLIYFWCIVVLHQILAFNYILGNPLSSVVA
jgi:uncharacterized membrane protein YsdA (DUF1294 family)